MSHCLYVALNSNNENKNHIHDNNNNNNNNNNSSNNNTIRIIMIKKNEVRNLRTQTTNTANNISRKYVFYEVNTLPSKNT